MSISTAVQKAIRIAKVNLGDIVRSAVYTRLTSSTYDVASGDHNWVPENIAIQWVPDKFSFTEIESGMYTEKDIKITVFNDDGSLNFQIDEKIELDSETYSIFKAFPTKIGAFTPVWSLVLRK